MVCNHNNMRLAAWACALASLASCASIGNPSGGPRDEDPPRFVRANPAPGALNVGRDRIDIWFDENVNVKDAFQKVVVSPPSKSVPRVSSQGSRVTVQFQDTLLPNTTYTVDFGNSIEDNNEANKLQGFAYTFSTGPELDTLRISGMVLSADALEPQQGMLVGLYSNMADSALSTLPMERIARTDDRGRFTIRGLKPGQYRIFALDDVDNDKHRANPEEAVAFLDYTLSPTAVRVEATDTTFNLLNGEVDTVTTRMRTRFLPNDVLLRSFQGTYKPQYLVKYERVDSTRARLVLNAPPDSLPLLSIVERGEFGGNQNDWSVLEASEHRDTLTYWLLPPALVALDSLRLAVTYNRTDSGRLKAVTDTLRFYTQRPRVKKDKNKKKKEEAADTLPPVIPNLQLKALSQPKLEIYAPVVFEFETPLTRLDTAAFRLEQMVDSVWTPVKGPWTPRRLQEGNPRTLMIEYPWQFQTKYRLQADSAAATGIYGLVSGPFEYSFETKGEDDYSAMQFDIVNFVDTIPAFVEMVNTSDKAVAREKVSGGRVRFPYLAPGKYYARIFEDRNGDGLYTPGDPDSLLLPDMAYYYPKPITLKKNWEKSETWDVFGTAVDLQKPDALKKNKPEADKRNRNRKNENGDDEEDEDDGYFDPNRNPFDPNDKNRRMRGM